MFQKIHDTVNSQKGRPISQRICSVDPQAIPEWLKYTEYLEIHHPYLFSLAYPEEPLVAEHGDRTHLIILLCAAIQNEEYGNGGDDHVTERIYSPDHLNLACRLHDST